MKKLIYLIPILFIAVACEDFLDPRITEERSFEQLLTQPGQIKGLVSFAYRAVPNTNDNYSNDFLESATDNAASNNTSGPISRMAEINSYWSASRSPINSWGNRYEEIMNLNQFFEIMENYDITFIKSSAYNDSLYKSTSIGEAYFLRAWCHFDLLRNYGGKDNSGQLKGVPIITELITPEDFLQLSRPSYDETVAQILKDIDSAFVYLPEKWSGTSLNQYENTSNLGRPTKGVCAMLKSRVLLYAASPAFNENNDTQKWEAAALAAKEALDIVGWKLPYVYVDDLTDMKKYFNNAQSPEIVYRRVTGATDGDRFLETFHSLPTLYGSGRCNPTQNLVDAFPMKNGYPIDHPESGYDPAKMYENRDPRFYMTIMYNGAKFAGTTVETFEGGKDMEGGSEQANVSNSTRTGYYMRKWLSDKVKLASGQEVNDYHYSALFRQVEMHLNFAEAMNEAYGPTQEIDGKSARDAIYEIAQRAVYLSSYPYIDEVTNGGKEVMREHIKNERRIELCFEGGHRFYDVRRWKDPLNSTLKKIKIPADNSPSTTEDLYTLPYGEKHYYCPIPQTEINKMPNLTQNVGW